MKLPLSERLRICAHLIKAANEDVSAAIESEAKMLAAAAAAQPHAPDAFAVRGEVIQTLAIFLKEGR